MFTKSVMVSVLVAVLKSKMLVVCLAWGENVTGQYYWDVVNKFQLV